MADLRIVDAPEIPTENITGEEKLPTGGNGNYSISLDSLADYTKTKKDLADNTSVDGKVNGVRQELDAHIEDLLNPHQVTKGQIGLGNVDNTADADKPVSNSTQASIISAVAPKADKTYVDNQLTFKANKADVYTKSETYNKQESSNLVSSSISTALTPVNSSLDLVKRGIANRYDSSLTYNSGERVVLANGDIVKSTIDGNMNDPNVNMTGWYFFDDKTAILTVESVASLQTLEKWSGRIVHTKGFYTADNFALAQPYKGWGTYIYDASKANINNEVTIINGWVLQFEVLNIFQAGAHGDFNKNSKTGHDDTQAFLNARDALASDTRREVYLPAANYLLSDTINLSMNNSYSFDGLLIRGEHSLNTHIYFKANAERHVLFKFFAPSGDTAGQSIRNLSISNHPDTLLKGIGVQLQGADFCLMRDFYINELFIGIHLFNDTTGYDVPEGLPNEWKNWTEFNRFETGRINQCQYNIMFEVGDSDSSFHGNTFNNIQNQIRAGGGVGVYCKGILNGNYAYLYNVIFNMQFFGVWQGGKGAAYMFKLEQATLVNTIGALTCEGDFTISVNPYSQMEHLGTLTYKDLLFWDVYNDYPNPTQDEMKNKDQDWGRVKFTNFSSKGVSNVGITQSDMETPKSAGFQALYDTQMRDPTNVLGSSFKAYPLNLDLNRTNQRTGHYPIFFHISGTNNESIGANFYGGGERVGLWFGNQQIPYDGGVTRFTPTACYRSDGKGVTVYNDEYRISIKGLNNTGTHSVFVDTIALASQNTATLSLGKADKTWNNIYTQNAPIVVSDERHKANISRLNEQELQCAIECSKLYRKYKLNTAVDEKGINAARYHFGAIAQDIAQCFIDHGLDWHEYGIITYEAWDAVEAVEYQAATYDEDGKMLTPEIQAIEAREAGEIYMVRYDELNCFINAGIEYRLSRLE